MDEEAELCCCEGGWWGGQGGQAVKADGKVICEEVLGVRKSARSKAEIALSRLSLVTALQR